MLVVIDLQADPEGRPRGTLRADRSSDQRFGDWLDLLRLLEACLQTTRHNSGQPARKPGPAGRPLPDTSPAGYPSADQEEYPC